MILEPKSASQHVWSLWSQFGPRGGRGFEPRTARNQEPRPRPFGPRGLSSWGIVPQGNHPPGESSPRAIIPLGNHPPGESFPWGITPLGNRPPGPWGITPLGNHPLCATWLPSSCRLSYFYRDSLAKSFTRPGTGTRIMDREPRTWDQRPVTTDHGPGPGTTVLLLELARCVGVAGNRT